ncbi:MAG: hypothetical protein COZ34_01515 [Candidatus Pacebacteria bacterium CG_4_10_14_3_um_filter_34_15]|nr:MAG: hypothetical protein COV78_02840 [Candidatus Pacebacteria bacterium CG11_big_fil_rev_8_21_14_0_20_34_55]PIX81765.1 MAG: hypothetical protein COZ34_01515 [Candidatus Pacebacteria bacterium CG_4_10_14_3_um_filter_34_15]PJC43466.1 MAG: hypothetical protein CO039_03885 [Candidatus Pacebacteria bacterium CG_4_9_14_0_2_um_filter_34_50]
MVKYMKILGIGESVIDKIHIVPGCNENLELFGASKTTQTDIGGPVLSALILLSRLDLDCTLLTSIGVDLEGQIIRQKLRQENVRIVSNIEEKTKVNTILVNRRNGQREKLRGKIKHSPIKNIPTEFIQQFDLIILDRHEKDAFYEVINKKNPIAKIIIDPSTEVSDYTKDMMRRSDYPIISIESLLQIGGHKGLTECLRDLYMVCNKPVIITAGEIGSIVFNGKESKLIPALKIKAIDTTGAGDIYRGAFAYGVVHGMNLEESAGFANSVAALQCTKLGNVSAIPSKEEVIPFAESFDKNQVSVSADINRFLLLDQSL